MKKIKELTETELEAIVGRAAIAIGSQLNRSPEDLLAEVIKRQAEVFRKGFADGATLTDAVEHLKAQGLQVGRRTLKGALQKAGVRIVSRRRIASVAKAAQADAVRAVAKELPCEPSRQDAVHRSKQQRNHAPLARKRHNWIEQRSGESVRRFEITQPNESATHRFF